MNAVVKIKGGKMRKEKVFLMAFALLSVLFLSGCSECESHNDCEINEMCFKDIKTFNYCGEVPYRGEPCELLNLSKYVCNPLKNFTLCYELKLEYEGEMEENRLKGYCVDGKRLGGFI